MQMGCLMKKSVVANFLSAFHHRWRGAQRQSVNIAMLLVLGSCLASPVAAVVPSGNLVPALGMGGNFSSAVRISNVQGGRGTATLFMAKPDPENAAKNRNYLDLCFVTADHVMRLKGGGGPSDEDDILPNDSNDQYGGNGPAPAQPVPAQRLGSIGIGSIGDPNGFNLSVLNGIVASKVILGDDIVKLNNLPTDMSFVGVTVDLDKLTVAQKNTLTGIPSVPLGVPPIDPALPGAMKFDFDMPGGYGVTGIVAAPPNNQYLFTGAIGQEYGKERFFQNTVQEYKQVVNTIYGYDAMKWVNGSEGMNVLLPGMGMPGDSGSAIVYNGTIIGVLTAGRMDVVNLQGGGTGLLLKNGYHEYAARMVPGALTSLTTLCADYTFASATVPEPAGFALAILGLIFSTRSCRQRV